MKLTNESFDMEEADCKELLEHLISKITKKSFLNELNPNNEIPFYICPFLPEYTLEVYEVIKFLKKQLEMQEIDVEEINLYKISTEILKNRQGNFFEKIQQQESQLSKIILKETLQDALNAEKYLVPFIQNKIENKNYKVLFIKGIGEVFPYIRTHNLLTNLQKVLKNQPSIIFFPGSYKSDSAKGSSLNLFCKFYNDNYYRALNILTML